MKRDSAVTNASAPYLHACYKYVQFILENRNRISSNQLSRTIWAIGLLKLSDTILIQGLGVIAMLHSKYFDTHDLAEVIWGLIKRGYEKPGAIMSLAKQVTSRTARKLP